MIRRLLPALISGLLLALVLTVPTTAADCRGKGAKACPPPATASPTPTAIPSPSPTPVGDTMPYARRIGAGVGGTYSASTTTLFFNPIGDGINAAATNEARARLYFPFAATLSNLSISVQSIDGASPAITVRLVKNGATGNQTVSVTTTGITEDTTNTDSVVDGDYVTIEVFTASGTNNIQLGALSLLVTPSTNKGIVSVTSMIQVQQDFGTTQHFPIGGLLLKDGASGDVTFTARTAMTLSRLGVNSQGTTINGDTVIRLVKNGSNGNQVVTIGSGVTGLSEDTTNTDSIAAGDTVRISVVTAGTSGWIGLQSIRMMVESDFQPAMASYPPGDPFGFGGVFHNSFAGAVFGNTLLHHEVVARYPMRAKQLFVDIQANTLNGDLVIGLLVNGVLSTLKVTIGAGQTGVFENTSDVVDISATDLIDTILDSTAASSGSFSPSIISFMQGDVVTALPQRSRPRVRMTH